MIHALFFASGFASLIYQVIWTRQFALLFGSTIQAASTTVAAFLFGLGVGARLAGWLIRRAGSPGRAFALLELTVAVYSLLLTAFLPHSLPLVHWLTSWTGESTLLFALARFCLLFCLLLPGCVAMGATLPTLAQLCSPTGDKLRESLAGLYAINTLGAASGAVCADFFLVRWLGVFHTALLASVLDCAVGLTGLMLLAGAGALPVPSGVASGARYVLALAFATGFCGLGLEIFWIRTLSFLNGSDIYSFSTVLATFLVGLVLGSWAAGRFGHERHLGRLLAALAVGILVSLLSALWLRQARELAQPLLQHLSFGAVRFLTAAVLVLPCTILLGAAFPLICERVSGMGAAEAVGRVYFWNTLGSLCGSLLCGFVLLPYLGLQGTLALLLLVATAAAAAESTRRRDPWPAFGAGAVLLLVWLMPSQALVRSFYGAEFARVRAYKEDSYGTAALISQWSPLEMAYTENLVVDGFNMMGNSAVARRYASGLAAMPILLHPAAEDVLVVAFGLANTLSVSVGLDCTRRVDCIELSPSVVELTGRLDYVARTLASPKLRIVYSDGRYYLSTTTRKYDVITAEPPPPVHAGIVNLYSREYFQQCRRCLKPGGLVAHWLPVNQMSAFEARTVLRACQDVFPYTYVYDGCYQNLIILAGAEPPQVDWPTLRTAFRRNAPLLNGYGWDRAEHLAGALLKTPEQVRAYVAGTPALTDNHPYLQHYKGVWQPDLEFYIHTPPAGVALASEPWHDSRPFLEAYYRYLLLRAPDALSYWTQSWRLSRALLQRAPQSVFLRSITRTSKDAQQAMRERLAQDERMKYGLFGSLYALGREQDARKFLEGSPGWPEDLKAAALALLSK